MKNRDKERKGPYARLVHQPWISCLAASFVAAIIVILSVLIYFVTKVNILQLSHELLEEELKELKASKMNDLMSESDEVRGSFDQDDAEPNKMCDEMYLLMNQSLNKNENMTQSFEGRLLELNSRIDQVNEFVKKGWRELNEKRVCPQTKYLFPDRGQKTDYLRVKKPVPRITEITICLWLTPPSGTFNTGFISYATSLHANAFLLWVDIHNFFLYLSNVERKYKTSLKTRTHICVAIDKPYAKLYLNGTLKASLVFPDSLPIEGGGSLVIGQDQDRLLGGFNKDQAFTGTIENLMIWRRILSAQEITNLTKDPCACSRDYEMAFTADEVEMQGGVIALPIDSC